MERNLAALYHDPPLWVDDAPAGIEMVHPSPESFGSMRDEIVRRPVGSHLELRVTREGLFVFDFSQLAEAALPPLTDGTGPRRITFGEDARKILTRTLAMNALLAFLYTAELRISRFSGDRMIVTPELTISMSNVDSQDMGFGNQSVSHLATSSYPLTYNPGLHQ